jgi:hypothetical protein
VGMGPELQAGGGRPPPVLIFQMGFADKLREPTRSIGAMPWPPRMTAAKHWFNNRRLLEPNDKTRW